MLALHKKLELNPIHFDRIELQSMIRPTRFTRRINMLALYKKLELNPIHFDRIEL